MDILKVLSRGIKQTGGKGANGGGNNNFLPTGAATLPSSGSSANPQLYHDPVAIKTSRKRKANTTEAVANDSDDSASEDDDLNELDFFSERKADPKPAKAKKQKREIEKKKSALLEEDECRQILRSHRLKLTLLVDRKGVVEAAAAAAAEAAAEAVVEKQRKRALKKKEEMSTEKLAKKIQKARDEAAAEATKQAKDDAKKQLFPQPLTAFSQLRQTYNLSARLADNLDRLLYKIPTEVQMASLPLLLDPTLALGKTTFGEDDGEQQDVSKGIDFMAVAPTGSGKTLSFLVPAINSILKRRAEEKEGKEEETNSKRKNNSILDTIVVAPTRELAHQIANEGKKLAAGTGVRVVDMRKGMRVQTDKAGDAEEEDIEEDDEDDDESGSEDDGKEKPAKVTITKTDILVTTPLMLLNTLRERQGDLKKQIKLKEVLPTVRTLVLDEADVLLDPLFRDQTLGIWSACTHPDMRATFWSATMASNIEELVAEEMLKRRNTAAATAGEDAESENRPLVRLVVGLKDTAVPNVTHKLVYTASEQGKLLAMRQLLHPSTSVSVVGSSSSSASGSTAPTALRPPFLVFTQTAERATALHDELKFDIPAAAGGADRIGVLHAALADNLRAAVVRKFRAGQIWVLITTDVLARGIDFAGVNGVVNYDVPTSAAAYVHRAGRTGRAGRQGGLSVTLYTKEDIPFVKSVANVIAASEKQAGGAKDTKSGAGIQQWLLDALPEVSKADKKKLKTRGIESRRAINREAPSKDDNKKGGKGGKGAPAQSRITSKSAWERRKDNNRRDAIAGSKQRKLQAASGEKGDDEEWGGLE
ncbi:atp-dependent rna helicase rok1 [Ophiostoma piceae UAMH 11346]|uniref:ATP-dependent RNA helicase ROK1 n=1 Tax=Ophiostoma piceae (strain UAMH 11346) TaxID=1262450 RepID=S3C7U5_OPHP1|nr:atp-dependent rna helicase rok1 [Ophiostoma piceae UAMH 11346]